MPGTCIHILAPVPTGMGHITFPFPHLMSAVSSSAGALTPHCWLLTLLLSHFSAWVMARAATRSGTWAHVIHIGAPSHLSWDICEFSYRKIMYCTFYYNIKVNAVLGTDKFQLWPVQFHAVGIFKKSLKWYSTIKNTFIRCLVDKNTEVGFAQNFKTWQLSEGKKISQKANYHHRSVSYAFC